MKAVLQNVPFRRFILGRLITNAGDSLYLLGTMWLVHELSGSQLYTGIAGFLVFIPGALQFLWGPLADRWPVKRVLVGTQVVQGGLIALIPLAEVVGLLNIPLILVIVPVAGLVGQLLYPAQNQAMPQIVDEEELASANSLLSLTYEGVDAVFTAMGGVLLAVLGTFTLFVIDVVSFAAVALIFASIPLNAFDSDTAPDSDTSTENGTDGATEPGKPRREMADEYLADLHEGVRYLAGSVLGMMTVGVALINFAYGGVLALLPVFADVRGGAGLYGLLWGAFAAGRLVGAVLGPRFKERQFSTVAIVGYSLGAAVWSVGVLVDWMPLTVAAFCLAMIPMGIMNVLIFTFLQTHVPEPMIGRVSSTAGSITAVALPLGSLLGGVLNDVIVINVITLMMGVAVFRIITVVMWIVHPKLRRLPSIKDTDPELHGLRNPDIE